MYELFYLWINQIMWWFLFVVFLRIFKLSLKKSLKKSFFSFLNYLKLLLQNKSIDKKLGGRVFCSINNNKNIFFRQKKTRFPKFGWFFFIQGGGGRWFELKKQYKNNPDVSITILAEFVVFFSGFLKSCKRAKKFFFFIDSMPSRRGRIRLNFKKENKCCLFVAVFFFSWKYTTYFFLLPWMCASIISDVSRIPERFFPWNQFHEIFLQNKLFFSGMPDIRSLSIQAIPRYLKPNRQHWQSCLNSWLFQTLHDKNSLNFDFAFSRNFDVVIIWIQTVETIQKVVELFVFQPFWCRHLLLMLWFHKFY